MRRDIVIPLSSLPDDWQRKNINWIFFFPFSDDDLGGAYGGSISSSTADFGAATGKNREADLCNPNFHNFNIYHTIDEDSKVSKSVEHLYDEIKHKNKEFGKYLPFFLLSF